MQRLSLSTLCLPGRPWHLLPLLLLPLISAGALAGGFALSGGDEQVLFSGGTPGEGAVARGVWSTQGGEGLALARSTSGWNYWLSGATLGDGMVRARVVLGARPDFTVLVRAAVDAEDDERLSAYGVSAESGALVWYRWEDGQVRTMGASATAPDLLKRRAIELVVYLIGPQLIATAYDADTLELLATVATRDAANPAGLVGLRAHDAQDSRTRLTRLSVQPTGAEASQEVDLFGSERLVEIRGADVARLPEGLRSALLFSEAERAALLTDPLGLERLRRAGISPLSVQAEVPFWAVDADYRAQRGRPPTRTERGYRLDLSYKDPELVEALVRGYAALYPKLARVHEVGRSAQGRPLLALRITDHPDRDEAEPAVLLNAAHHGNELLPVDYALDAVRLLLEEYGRDARVTRWVDGLDIWLVPLVNPDGNHMFTHISRAGGRKNARDLNGNGRADPWDGVDLNRNYPFRWGSLGETGSKSDTHSSQYRGPHAGSEAETQAMMALALRLHPAAVISWHTNATVILSPYTIDGVENPTPDEAWSIAEAMATAGGQQPSGRPYEVRRKLYSVDGTDQDWHRFTYGATAFIIEGSHRRPEDPAIRQASIDGVRPLMETLLDRVLDGPRLSGAVTDTRGAPLDAEVIVEPIRLNAGEVWTARALDGRFDRLLPGPGTYTVRARKVGYQDAVRTVSVETVADVQLSMKPARGR